MAYNASSVIADYVPGKGRITLVGDDKVSVTIAGIALGEAADGGPAERLKAQALEILTAVAEALRPAQEQPNTDDDAEATPEPIVGASIASGKGFGRRGRKGR